MKTTSNSRVMHMAHILHKNKPSHQWGSIVKYAWYFERLRKWMQTGSVTFSFWKADGSIREAHGTLNMSLIPQGKWPKGTSAVSGQYSVFTFFDLDKQEWRSFDICRFIGFVTLYSISEGSLKREK